VRRAERHSFFAGQRIGQLGGGGEPERGAGSQPLAVVVNTPAAASFIISRRVFSVSFSENMVWPSWEFGSVSVVRCPSTTTEPV
jgi:hypothetical protein